MKHLGTYPLVAWVLVTWTFLAAASAKNGEDVRLWLEQGTKLYHEQKLAEALVLLRKVAEHENSSAITNYYFFHMLGACELDQGNEMRGIRALEEVLTYHYEDDWPKPTERTIALVKRASVLSQSRAYLRLKDREMAIAKMQVLEGYLEKEGPEDQRFRKELEKLRVELGKKSEAP